MPLIELRVHRGIRVRVSAAGPSASRTIVIGLFPPVVCGRIPRLIALWLLPGVVGGRGQIGRASCKGKSVDLGGRRIIKKKKKECGEVQSESEHEECHV